MGPGRASQDDAGMENGDQGGVPAASLPASFPGLEGAEEGQKVTLEGTVQSNDGETVTIGCDSAKVQDNMADKALGKITGKKPGMGKPAPAAGGQEDEDY